ncbi:Transposon TX1 uncharacterized 149 kDa protein [Vitis vinifera]|uniref:Transposon TX1 uncharacterized 149 kDa protein n=1 Tax=Vitis vinifera TaxID=29760 RepID=A0A438EPI2_VITVI|nr:Transposon TX1 uncharacterized 149 kDa protein [Vitis vinifera]
MSGNKHFLKVFKEYCQDGLQIIGRLFGNQSIQVGTNAIQVFRKALCESFWRIVESGSLDWSPISGESASRLESPFTEEEIYKAIFQMDRDKAPGPDGFTIAVFQDCWEVIKEDLVRVFVEFHRSGIINQSTNASFIVLLPKKSMSRRISDFRPISLITSLYKIIAKVLAGRLRGVLHETIHSSQGAFVQGRQILDAVLIANEIVDEKEEHGRKELYSKLTLKRPMTMASGWAGTEQGYPIYNLQMIPFFFSSTQEEDMMTLKSVLLVLAEMLDCKASGWPILYLGLPLGGNPKASGFWDPVIERISRRLDGWQKAYLSFGGVGEGKRDHLVNWDVVCKPKSRGGLGFGKISMRNVALLGKWLWRYPREGSALWHQMVSSLSLEGHCTCLQEFSKFTRFVVGDGDRIRFWDDLWWGDQPLGIQYPRLLSVVTDKNAPISSILGYSRPFSWNFNFRRNLTDSEIEDLESLMRSLDRLHLSPSVPDKRSWSISPSGLFTVKSFFLALSQYSESPPVFPTKFVWNSQVPFKVKSFVWLVAHKKVNTNDLLQLRRPHKALSPDIFSKDGLGFPKEHL